MQKHLKKRSLLLAEKKAVRRTLAAIEKKKYNKTKINFDCKNNKKNY